MSFLNLKTFFAGRTPTSEPSLSPRSSRSSTSSAQRKHSLCSPSTSGSSQSSSSTISPPRRVPVVETVPEDTRDYIKYPYIEEPVRVFIVDRRRAILERIAEKTVWNYDYQHPQEMDETAAANMFVTDQYSDNTLPAWAFRFNFDQWTKDYNITQVIIQNLACFLDFEKAKMAMAPLPNTKDDQNGNKVGGNVLTPPYSGDEKGAAGAVNSPSSQLDPHSLYHRLPSSQEHQEVEQFSVLDDEALDNLRTMSGGRIERLAVALSGLPDFEHLILRDHSCFQQRPTLMLFWLLKMLPASVIGLTLDDIQAETPINLEDVMPYHRLRDIKIKLSKTRSAFAPQSCFRMLMKWLSTPADQKHRIRVHFCQTDITLANVFNFIQAWRCTPEPQLFEMIVVDIGHFWVNDFCRVVERTENDWITPYVRRNLGDPVQRAVDKQYVWKHKKSSAVIHYRYRNGQYVFTSHSCSDEMLYNVLTDEQFASVKRAVMFNLIGPKKLPFATKDMTVLSNITEPQTSFLDSLKGMLTGTNA